MSSDQLLGVFLGACATLCCGALIWKIRARRRASGVLTFSIASGLDDDEVRFQRRLEAATASAFEVQDDAELELTAQEIAAIQTLERELRELKARKVGAAAAAGQAPTVMAALPAPQQAAAPPRPAAAPAPSVFVIGVEEEEEEEAEAGERARAAAAAQASAPSGAAEAALHAHVPDASTSS